MTSKPHHGYAGGTEAEAGGGSITRRKFIQIGFFAGVAALVPRSWAAGTGRTGGKTDGKVVCVPESVWPQPPSFSKYAARASFSDAAEANKRVRGRRYPIRLRSK